MEYHSYDLIRETVQGSAEALRPIAQVAMKSIAPIRLGVVEEDLVAPIHDFRHRQRDNSACTDLSPGDLIEELTSCLRHRVPSAAGRYGALALDQEELAVDGASDIVASEAQFGSQPSVPELCTQIQLE